jgi:hypothetical protein
VVFDESAQWSWTNGDRGGGDGPDNLDDMFTMQYRVLHGGEEDGTQEMETRTPQAASFSLGAGLFRPTSGSPIAALEGPSEEDLDANHDDAPLRLCSINEVMGATMPLGYTMHVLSDIDE